MISVSSEFQELMQTRTDFYCEAEITLANGDTFQLSADDFSIANNAYTDGAGASAIPLGEAICRSIELELINDDDRYINTDFYGASILLVLSFKLSSTTESIVLGTFTVTEPETYGVVVSITAVDAMYKADKTYTTSLTFPASLQSMFLDICDQCDLAYNTATFANSDFLVSEQPSSDYTFRQVLGYIAQIAGGNARINRQGYLEILSYDLEQIYNGEGHYLTDWISLTVATSDITVTGIQTTKSVSTTTTDDDGNETTETTEETVLYGSDGYVLTVSNPLISGQEEDALPLIGAGIMGVEFRIFSGEYIAYPLAEFMDNVVFTDRKGNTYQSFITDIDFTFFGQTSLSNSAESGLRNASTYAGSGTDTLIAAKKLVEAEKTARETAMAAFQKQISQASGLYITAEEQEDGSTIYYLHDKPTLEESTNIMKLTSEGIGLSSDGGETYPYGYTVTGEMITSILSTEGINADWINTGSLVVEDAEGNIILYISPGENSFYINAPNFTLDSDGNVNISALDEIQTTVASTTTRIENAEADLEEQSTTLTELSENLTTQVESLQTQIEQTAESITLSVEGSITTLTETTEGLQEELSQYATYFSFTDDGLAISESGSPFAVLLGTTQLSFTESDAVVAYISNTSMYITNAEITNTLRIGNFVWQSHGSGNMGLVYSPAEE